MDLYGVFYYLYHQLTMPSCNHGNISLSRQQCYCPDCGYRIKLLWTFIRCRGCGSKRIPRHYPDSTVGPLQKYCRHCGTSEYRLVKKEKIEAHDLIYCIPCREIDYSGDPPETAPTKYSVNAFSSDGRTPQDSRLDIVEGQVIRKMEYRAQ